MYKAIHHILQNKLISTLKYYDIIKRINMQCHKLIKKLNFYIKYV